MIWLVASVYSFAAAIGFAALARETAVAEQKAQVDLRETLELMRQSPRWKSSAACADATAAPSKDFCVRYAAVEAKLTGAPCDGDPQAALFARMIGLSPETMRIVLSVFLAVACEVISALGFFATLQTNAPSAKLATAQVHWKPPKWSQKLPAKVNGVALPHWRGWARLALPCCDMSRPVAAAKN